MAVGGRWCWLCCSLSRSDAICRLQHRVRYRPGPAPRARALLPRTNNLVIVRQERFPVSVRCNVREPMPLLSETLWLFFSMVSPDVALFDGSLYSLSVAWSCRTALTVHEIPDIVFNTSSRWLFHKQCRDSDFIFFCFFITLHHWRALSLALIYFHWRSDK